MRSIQTFTIFFVALGVTQAQMYGNAYGQVRTYVPPPDPCAPTPTIPAPPSYCPNNDNSEDLSSLIALLKLLEQDCSPQKPNSNDVNTAVIIDKLINALVYTTTHCAACQGSSNGGSSGSSGGSGNEGLIAALLAALLGGGGSGGSGASANTGTGSSSIGNSGASGASGNEGLVAGLLAALLGGGGSGGNAGSSSNSGSKTGDQGLIDLNLLDRNDLLKLILGKQDILRLGVGSENSSQNSGSTSSDGNGAVGGVLNSVLSTV